MMGLSTERELRRPLETILHGPRKGDVLDSYKPPLELLTHA